MFKCVESISGSKFCHLQHKTEEEKANTLYRYVMHDHAWPLEGSSSHSSAHIHVTLIRLDSARGGK